PWNAASKGMPFTRIYLTGNGALPHGDVEIIVTAKRGWPAVPYTIKHATLLQAARLVRGRNSPTDVIGIAEMGAAIRISRLDPDIDSMVADFRRWEGVVAK